MILSWHRWDCVQVNHPRDHSLESCVFTWSTFIITCDCGEMKDGQTWCYLVFFSRSTPDRLWTSLCSLKQCFWLFMLTPKYFISCISVTISECFQAAPYLRFIYFKAFAALRIFKQRSSFFIILPVSYKRKTASPSRLRPCACATPHELDRRTGSALCVPASPAERMLGKMWGMPTVLHPFPGRDANVCTWLCGVEDASPSHAALKHINDFVAALDPKNTW